MTDYFSLPAGIAHSPVARRVKETQFIVDKSQGDDVLWFNQRRTDYCWQGKHNQKGIGLLIHFKNTMICMGCQSIESGLMTSELLKLYRKWKFEHKKQHWSLM